MEHIMWENGSAVLKRTDSSTYHESMQRLAVASERIIRKYYRSAMPVDMKSDHSPVTDADRETEATMRELLMQEYPDHGILGEEYGPYQEHARYQWVLDPIDGTKSFISGMPLFGTLIALCDRGTPIMGCINLPILGLRFIGTAKETRMNGQPVRMRTPTSVHEATLLVTDHTDVWRHKDGKLFDRLAARVGVFRSWGDCYGYTMLASGYADIMADPVLKPWDMLPIIPVIQGAGGMITSWEGGDPLQSNSLVASHPDVHSDIISLLNRPPATEEHC